jgi:hypothetical protein
MANEYSTGRDYELLMREIVLATWGDILKRVDNIVRSLEIIYLVKLRVDFDEILVERLFPTEDFLENDKVALVFMKIVKENYDVPIIVVQSGGDYFILDGHHRSFIRRKLMDESIKAYVLKFSQGASYREVLKFPLDDLRIRDVSAIENPILKAWQRTLFVLEHYEAIYHIPFYLTREQVNLRDLVPTQPQVGKAQVDAIKELLVPIVCVHDEGKYYILDGHARSLRAKQLGLDSIDAMILVPRVQMCFGIVQTAADMNLWHIEDVRIIE